MGVELIFHCNVVRAYIRDSVGGWIEIDEELRRTHPEAGQPQAILVRLRPADGETTFSMFGTDRAITTFGLEIYPIADPTGQERCKASGWVSYTADNETYDDCIYFLLFVKPETFARYAAKVAHGLVDKMTLCVGSVDGFYSEWSPFSISTRKVKVVTQESETQKITLPPGHQDEPLRLGDIGSFSLSINRCLEFGKRAAPEPEAIEEIGDFGTERAVPQTQDPGVVDPRILQMLRSLRRAAWFIACLLALIIIVTLSKG